MLQDNRTPYVCRRPSLNRTLSLLIALIAAPLPMAFGEGAPEGPKAVVAVTAPDGTIVSWIPPEDALQDETAIFRIYGLGAEGATTLGNVTAPATSFLAPAGYGGYGVSTIIGGVESAPTMGCTHIYLPPHIPPPISCVPAPDLAKVSPIARKAP